MGSEMCIRDRLLLQAAIDISKQLSHINRVNLSNAIVEKRAKFSESGSCHVLALTEGKGQGKSPDCEK